jgi:predicted MFS family arabinose efflux permease
MQAYIGDHVQYSRRGTVFALAELSWSASFLLIIPAIGWLIARGGWHAPFRWLALAAAAAGLVLSRLLPRNQAGAKAQRTFFGNLRSTFIQRQALSGLAFGSLISVGNDLVAIVYGAWLEQEFGLQVAALGLASTVVGLGLLAGEVGAWGLVDRMGKKRALISGTLISALTSLALPLLGASLTWALIGLFLFYTSFEFMLVTSMPLMTELVPEARATFMSGYVASFSAGRALGAWLGPALFSYGLLANGLAAAGVYLLAIIVLSFLVPVE